jgi:hypothetical protein
MVKPGRDPPSATILEFESFRHWSATGHGICPRPSGHLLEFSPRDWFGKTIVNLRQSFPTMLTVSPINVDSAHAWRDAGNYAFVGSLPSTGCAWEFLRRNPDYQNAWRAFASKSNLSSEPNPDPTVFGLVHFESPERDARSADVFWHRSLSREVLPVTASKPEPAHHSGKLPLNGLQCRVVVQRGQRGEQHILFAQDGRSLQLDVQGPHAIEAVRLTTEIVLSPRLVAARVQALRRFADMVTHRRLRPPLYPPERRACRLMKALQAFDAMQAGASHRHIAAALFGESIVRDDWSGRSDYLRLRVQRLLRFAERLVKGGYRDLLR